MNQPYPWQTALWERVWQQRGTLHHALLLYGKKGLGKLDFARALAQALLCENLAGGRFACGACASCRWFAQGSHPDFRLIEPEAAASGAVGESGAGGADESARPDKKAATQITVDQVRQLQDFLTVTTHRQGYRAIILNPAEAMNSFAANALLKILEEPPPRTLFLLVAHQPRRLLPTVLSRCRRLPVPPPVPAEAEAWLAAQGVEQGGLYLAQAGNAPLMAVEVSQPEYQSERIKFLKQLSDPTAAGRVLEIAAAAQAVPMGNVIHWMSCWCHDLMMTKLAGRLRFNPDFAAALGKLASAIGNGELIALQTQVANAVKAVNHPLNPRLFLEQLLLSYFHLVTPPEHGAHAGL